MEETTREKFQEVLGKFDTAVLTTLDDEGKFHSRPMAIAEIDEGGDLIFFTDQGSPKAKEIKENAQVAVSCQNGWKDTVVLRGTASVFRDAAKAKKLWRKTFQTWFPGGPDDPNLAMIRVRGESGEYWDNSGVQGLKYVAKAVKAIATGKRPEPDTVDEHGVVKLR
jgi:general stress protein 26